MIEPAPSLRSPTHQALAPRAAAAASAALPRELSTLTTPASRNRSVRPWLVPMLVNAVRPATRASVATCCSRGAVSVTSEYTEYCLSSGPARHSRGHGDADEEADRQVRRAEGVVAGLRASAGPWSSG